MKMIVRMRCWGLTGLLCLFMIAVLVLPQAGGVRAWSGDSTVNTAICTVLGYQYSPQITSDGSGGAIITWQDYRSGNADIYAQRVNSSGTAQWTADGVAICTASGSQSYPQIASDGSGGAIITWYDGRSGNDDIYAQRVNSAGTAQWAANGVAICTASGEQGPPQITSDGSGGAIITWQDYRSGNADIYAQRVNSSGAVQWTADGVAICTASGDQRLPQIISDGSGGVIITWYDGRSGNADIYAQRVDSSGAVQWTADGVAICTAAGDQYAPEITSDGLGGGIITWQDGRSGNADIYAQRVDSSGAVQWAADGVAICTTSGDQYSPRITSDGSGGAIITWYDRRNGNYDIYARRVDSSGNVLWAADGVAICTASGDQLYPEITSDGSGGAIITWQDGRSGSMNDIYAQWVESSGSLVDTIPPTVTLSSTATSSTNVSPIPVTATFSETVTGFAVGDITVGNGAAGNFVAVSTRVYTFDVTPSGQGVVTVNVAAAVAQDAATNWNTAATQYSITYDTVAPTVTLTSTANSPTKVSPIPMTATFSEAVTGFAVGDITVGNSAAGNFAAVSGTVYTFDVTPAGQGVVTVNVAAAVAQDAASNGNTAATQYSITYVDTTPPTVTLTSTATSPTRVSPIPMTATFSEAVTGFVVGDITVGNGTAGNFAAVSGPVYTFDVTPAGQGVVTVDVAAGVAQDAASNGNTAATQYSITYDSLPTITSFTTSSADEGYSVIITGTKFTGATAVKFGDTDALSFTVDSDTQITAVVSSGTSGKITVTTAGGTATSADDFTPPAGSVNPWLIVGIIAGVVFIGAIAWWLMRLRRKRGQHSA